MEPRFIMNVSMIFAILLAALHISGCEGLAEARDDPGESIVVSGFSDEFNDFDAAIDIEFSRSVMEGLSRLGDDPETGFRTAASPAEAEAAGLVEQAMLDAGLKNVTRDKAAVDGWTFSGASLIFEDFKGNHNIIDLGGYPCSIQAKGEALMLADLGHGSLADYEGRDVAGKLVLIDADPEELGVALQARQAKLKGARAVIARTALEPGDAGRIASHGLHGQTDAPVLAISAESADALRKELRRSDAGELATLFSADSTVHVARPPRMCGARYRGGVTA
jgi:hypothetical protein